MTSSAPRLSRRSLLAGSAATATAFTLMSDRADARPLIGSTLARGLAVPWGLAFLPNGDALVTERESGRVHRVRRTGGRHQVGDVAGVQDHGEGGLMGVALSPTFRSDRHVFFYLTGSSDNRVIRMTYRTTGTLGDRRTILAGIPRSTNHDGGQLLFGPSGKLYVSTGDALDRSQAQNRNALNGKILRIDPDGSTPSDNPFGNRVWTLGHRNVQGLAIDSRHRLWATELGENDRDELNRIVKGHDYGWPTVEGGDGPGGFHDPYVTWSPTDTCSPSGLAIARGAAWVGALHGACLWRVDISGTGARTKTRYFHDTLGRIRAVAAAPDGSLWVTTSNRDGRGRPRTGDDKVVRIRFT
ncbi:PQQ-dependent sugar dehydrogenase [Nocardioides marmoribigeumensis]|uniref:Glucose/arabinose dehydrogenase n=1 Tax=Nocardioides marmoribigeumensis TaxID=433649 RepID=A0ABU2BVY2_9ACTN|nr:PQQ-dependent sugar dehydrogenase [Nocardioides marmoribigeumensis]MDR7362793.1 glucose/arabinose dehydrogenase [Nocardioides marmoribigeumensis]